MNKHIPPKLPYSPKLKHAMAEIAAILKRADIAGYILLHEPGFSEYRLHIETSWSVVRAIEGGAHIRSKLEDYAGDRVRQQAEMEASVNMIRHLADGLARDARFFESIHGMLAERFEIEHTEGTHIPHRPH